MDTSKRLAYWDNIKGWLILLVVFGHFLLEISDITTDKTILYTIYMFHMPAFIFVSGYFSKSEHSREFESILKLLVAYILLSSGFMLWRLFCYGEAPSIITPYYSAWYLLALVVWRVSVPYVAKIKYSLIFLTLISIFSIFYTEINLQYGMIKILAFYPFFMAGYLIPTEKIQSILAMQPLKKILIGLSFAIIASIIGTILLGTFRVELIDLIPNTFQVVTLHNVYVRILLLLVSSISICAILFLSIEKKIPFLTKIGRNTLSIYILHRPITFLFASLITKWALFNYSFICSIIATIFLCLIIGSDYISNLVNKILEFICSILTAPFCSKNIKLLVGKMLIIIILIILLGLPEILSKCSYNSDLNEKSINNLNLTRYRVMNNQQEEQFTNAFKIIFSGDLILLEDQVKNGFDGKNYNFDSNFEYTKKYISNADFAIGVLEGPLGKGVKKFSQSNFDDNKFLYVNYPDEWADSIKKAGFDLVTTANNHVLDVGLEGVKRTIKILNEKGISYTGSYLNYYDIKHNNIKLIEKNGIKMVFLTYTYGINYYDTDRLFRENLLYITTILPEPSSPQYKNAKEEVKNDFKKAKSMKPDLIIVLPHWGTQFTGEIDNYQKVWGNNFVEYGADIILGDHTHHVQPVKITQHNGKDVFTLYSPGNYANIYRKDNGDSSALVEIYIDKKNKKVIGGAIIPMFTQSLLDGNYRAIPIGEIFHNKKLKKEISTYDYERISDIHRLITKNMLNKEMNINMYQQKYYFDKLGFLRKKHSSLYIDNNMKHNTLYPLLKSSENVCFIGDSVTAGSNNNGAPWFEPISTLIKGKIINKSWGGETTKLLITKHLQIIENIKADLFIIAIGTNDVRYRDKKICAMNENEYINNLKILRQIILKNNPNAKFVFIAPWFSTDGDTNTPLSYEEKLAMNNKYTKALENWSKLNKDYFINANPDIQQALEQYPREIYMVDFVHPNLNKGIELYSRAVMNN